MFSFNYDSQCHLMALQSWLQGPVFHSFIDLLAYYLHHILCSLFIWQLIRKNIFISERIERQSCFMKWAYQQLPAAFFWENINPVALLINPCLIPYAVVYNVQFTLNDMLFSIVIFLMSFSNIFVHSFKLQSPFVRITTRTSTVIRQFRTSTALSLSNTDGVPSVDDLGNMKLNDLKDLCKQFGGKPGTLRKPDLVDLCRSLILANPTTTATAAAENKKPAIRSMPSLSADPREPIITVKGQISVVATAFASGDSSLLSPPQTGSRPSSSSSSGSSSSSSSNGKRGSESASRTHDDHSEGIITQFELGGSIEVSKSCCPKPKRHHVITSSDTLSCSPLTYADIPCIKPSSTPPFTHSTLTHSSLSHSSLTHSSLSHSSLTHSSLTHSSLTHSSLSHSSLTHSSLTPLSHARRCAMRRQGNGIGLAIPPAPHEMND